MAEPGENLRRHREEVDDSGRRRAVAGMVAAALTATGEISQAYPGCVTEALIGLEGYGSVWLQDPNDSRGTVLREFVEQLVTMVRRVDATESGV